MPFDNSPVPAPVTPTTGSGPLELGWEAHLEKKNWPGGKHTLQVLTSPTSIIDSAQWPPEDPIDRLLMGEKENRKQLPLATLELKTIYEGVNKIAGTSGLAYLLEKGADIRLDSLQIWDDIMKTTKGVLRFRNKGWVHYKKMKLVVPLKSKGKEKFSIADTPTLPSSTSHSAILSSSLATYQTTGQSGEGSHGNLNSEGRDTTVGMIASASVTTNYLPIAIANQGPNMPSIPSSYIGSTVTSITPSSSISARMEHSNKCKADDDNVSMASATCGSAVTMHQQNPDFGTEFPQLPHNYRIITCYSATDNLDLAEFSLMSHALGWTLTHAPSVDPTPLPPFDDEEPLLDYGDNVLDAFTHPTMTT
ncbi:hypothetical protein OG21DRAFT_1556450 [Imleria badia]|nr:hypothetical protein OG21DRAFT_1556450 [Imleria badia]